MMNAYDKLYLTSAQDVMGGMLQFVSLSTSIDVRDFYSMFLSSNISHGFECGVPRIIAGHSGPELAIEILSEFSQNSAPIDPVWSSSKTPAYWAGHVLAYYQWYSGLRFEQIENFASFDRILDMYSPYHEMDTLRFVDHMEELRSSRISSPLREYRKLAGYSQSELAALTDIPLKTIQNLEQKQKDIHKLRVDYCIRLANALDCDIEMLM